MGKWLHYHIIIIVTRNMLITVFKCDVYVFLLRASTESTRNHCHGSPTDMAGMSLQRQVSIGRER